MLPCTTPSYKGIPFYKISEYSGNTERQYELHGYCCTNKVASKLVLSVRVEENGIDTLLELFS